MPLLFSTLKLFTFLKAENALVCNTQATQKICKMGKGCFFSNLDQNVFVRYVVNIIMLSIVNIVVYEQLI